MTDARQAGRRVRLVAALALTLLLPLLPRAAEAQVGPNGFTTTARVTVRGTPATVYAALVDVGRWWSPDHTYSGDAANLTLEPRAGGCFCEKLKNGGGVEHMRVVNVVPGELLRLQGGLGPLQTLGVAGSMTITLKPDAGNTAVTLVYAVGGFNPGGFRDLSLAVSAVLTEQLQRLQSLIERGRPK